jgi:hypothetical protein
VVPTSLSSYTVCSTTLHALENAKSEEFSLPRNFGILVPRFAVWCWCIAITMLSWKTSNPIIIFFLSTTVEWAKLRALSVTVLPPDGVASSSNSKAALSQNKDGDVYGCITNNPYGPRNSHISKSFERKRHMVHGLLVRNSVLNKPLCR